MRKWKQLVLSVVLVLILSGLALAYENVVGVMLSSYLNNDGISYAEDTLDGDLDFSWQNLPAEQLPASDTEVYFQKVWFHFPSKEDGDLNNVAAYNQQIYLPFGNYHDIHLLATATNGPQKETAVLTYADGTEEVPLAVSASSGRASFGGHLVLGVEYMHGSVGRIETPANLFAVVVPVDPTRELRSITLPENPNIHIFALSLGLEADLVVAEEVERWNRFTLSDLSGDDRGPGSYVYPAFEVFKPGTFDLAEVELLESVEDYLLKVTVVGPVENPWGAPHGFSVHLLHLYFDTQSEGGATQSIPGANVAFAQPWNRAVVVDGGWGQDIAIVLAEKAPELTSQVLLSDAAWVEGQSIHVSIPKDFLGEYKSSWGIQVLMLGHEGDPGSMDGAHVRRVVVDAGADWQFGGGDGHPAKPNVIDLLTPPGLDQYEVLSGYQTSGELSVIPLVYPFQ